jgi:[histone H3]-trimethyl-L-lysine4 demethylase
MLRLVVLTENPDNDAYVDTKEMLDTFSKDVIYMKLPPPYTQTLFVELVRFTPGQPDSVAGTGTSNGIAVPNRNAPTPVSGSHPPYQNGSSPHLPPRSGLSAAPTPGSSHRPASPSTPYERTGSGGPHQIPPPPPWSSRSTGSRWSNAAASAPPPSSRGHPPEASSPADSPPLATRKRKHPDDIGPNGGLSITIPSPTMQPSPKRRSTMPTLLSTPGGQPIAHSPVAHTLTQSQQPMHSSLVHPANPQHMPPSIPPMRAPPLGPVGPPAPMHPAVHPPSMQAMHASSSLPPPMHPPMHNGALPPTHSPVQPLQTPPMQTRAPSIAMMLSPTPSEVVLSPQRQQPQQPPQQLPPPPVQQPSQPPPRNALPAHVSPHPMPQQIVPGPIDPMSLPRHPVS